MNETLQIHHDTAACRFSAELDGHAMELDYRLQPGQIVFTHTGVPPALQGRGLAGQLVAQGLAWAASQEREVVPACSYVAAYLKRHPRWLALTLATNIQAVLNYWFGVLGSPDDGQIRPLWFRKSEQTDREIEQGFAARVEEALAGQLASWDARPLGRLARILLLDQFSRNIYRGQARSFAGDAQALQDTLALLSQDQLQRLTPLQQWFALMPLEHAEDMAMQDRAVAEFTRLAEQEPRLAGALDYAEKHRAVIAQFGRFPHRNAILGRISTAEEQAYLAQPGSGF
ncbi:DUF924 family protein [Paucibacter sp. AS339]|uniref:DUF924 family protein n=1 Tax=Paucibacter hankyongi TaxID=3133434 RepID=UPI00309C5A72